MFRSWRTDWRAALEPHHAQGEPDRDRPGILRTLPPHSRRPRRGRLRGRHPASDSAGRLRVHCYPVLARFIAPIVTAYLRDYPEVSVDLRRDDQLIDLLEEGFDLAIRPYVPPDSSLMVRRLPIARQPRERDAAFKDDARGSPCPSYRTASTTRLVAATTCCASSRIGGGSSVRAASHQRAAAWPSNPRKAPISGWPRRHPPVEAEERLLVSNTPRGHSIRATIRVLRWVRRD